MSCRIVTAGIGGGKSSAMERLSHAAPCDGFITDKHGGERYLRRISTGESVLLMSPSQVLGARFRRWYISEEAFSEACSVLCSFRSGIVLIDEVGRLELEGRGFAPAIPVLLGREDVSLTIAVRSGLAEDVISFFGIRDAAIVQAALI